MNIRIATLEDIEVISTMYRDFFAFHADLQSAYCQKAESGEYPVNAIKSKAADIIVAHEAGIIAGFVHVLEDKTPPYDSVVPHRFAICMDLFVIPSYRKRGIGATLVNAAKEWAKKRQLDYVEIRVLVENENALRLYIQEEFKPVQSILRCTL